LIHPAYIRDIHDADGEIVGFETNWDELPKFVIRTRDAATRRLAWVSDIDGRMVSMSILPQMAMTFLDGDEAVRAAWELRELNRFLPFRVAIRPGRKKV
jgi:hypothetical protein